MKTKRTFLAALTLMCAMTMTTVLISCTNDDNPVTKPIEYGKVFNYTYEGQTLYYIVNEKGEASVVAPLYPDLDTVHDEMWTGYDKPVPFRIHQHRKLSGIHRLSGIRSAPL